MRINQLSLTGLMLVGCCLMSAALLAQDYRPGYIIKTNADSISGFVKYTGRKNETTCDFKPSKKSSHVSFTPADLLAYGFTGDRKFISTTLPGTGNSGEKVFFAVLSQGPLTLYRYNKTFYIQKDQLMKLPVPKGKIVDPVEEGGVQMEVKDKRYVSILNTLLADCQMKADETSYAEGDLTKLINNYNRCKGITPPDKKLKPLYRANVGVLTGYVSSNLTLKESAIVPFSQPNTKFEPSRSIIGGASLDISSPRAFDRLFLTVEGWYFKTVYIGTDYRENMKQDITLDVSSVRMFLGLRYNFLHESHTPFVKAGISGTITQDMELSSIIEKQNEEGQIIYDDKISDKFPIKKVRGFWFAVGYDQVVVGKMKAFVEFRYERADAYFGTALTPDSKLNNLSALVGIRF